MQGKNISEITEQLEKGIKDLMESGRFKEYLNTMSRFHNYSLNNTLLIVMQNPNASYVAGFQSWKNNFNRYVKVGEKGIKILAPTPYKKKIVKEEIDTQGNKVLDREGNPVLNEMEITVPAFKVVTVFDVSQTEGKELPEIVHELDGTVEKFADFMQALEKTSPVPITYKDIEGRAKGYFSNVEKRIAIQGGMSQIQTMKTGIHEVAHAILHARENPEVETKDKFTKEVEAESVAYTVCQYYGIDTSEYSFGYVAGWSGGKELKELRESLETIRVAASRIITSIDENMTIIETKRELQQSHRIDKEVATITCEWSEHPAFEDGKTYSVMEFDELMKKSDMEWCEGREREIEKWGDIDTAIESGESLYQGYAKVKFTINLPEGFIPQNITERLDVGDGMGGVIDYFKSLPEYRYGGITKVLEVSKKLQINQHKTDKPSQKPSVLSRLHANQDRIRNEQHRSDGAYEQNKIKEGGLEK